MKRRKSYNPDFKREIVLLALHSDKSMSEIEREYGLSDGLVNQWVHRAKKQGEKIFKGDGEFSPESEEILRLRREVASLQQDNEILKKAIAICTHPSETDLSK